MFVAACGMLAASGCSSASTTPVVAPDASTEPSGTGGPTYLPTTGGAVVPPTSVSPDASDGAIAAGDAGPVLPAECSGDGDCIAVASYCADAACVCRAFTKDHGEPKCTGPKVACFADPCLAKAASCQGGRCAIVPKPQ